jgi:hypothetical protein
MIDMTNRPYVAVRLITIKFLFRHLPSSLRNSLSPNSGAGDGNRTRDQQLGRL